MDQLLDLLEGRAGNGVLDTALEIIQNLPVSFVSLSEETPDAIPDLSVIFQNRSSVRAFFLAMGQIFPSSFLRDSRNSLEFFGGDQDLIVSLCGIDSDEALDNK